MRNSIYQNAALRGLVLGGLLIAALPVFAGNPAPAASSLPNWELLTTAQRDLLLAPTRERWNNASPEHRARMLEHAQKWQSMTPEQRKQAHHGMRRWQHMNPEQREQMRALYGEMRKLPPEQRQALKAEWRKMTPEQRKAWIQQHPLSRP